MKNKSCGVCGIRGQEGRKRERESEWARGTCHVLVVPRVDQEATWAQRRMSREEKGWTRPDDWIRLCHRAAASGDEPSPAPPLHSSAGEAALNHVTSSARGPTRRYPSSPLRRRLHQSSSVFIRLLPSSPIPPRPQFSHPVNHSVYGSPPVLKVLHGTVDLSRVYPAFILWLLGSGPACSIPRVQEKAGLENQWMDGSQGLWSIQRYQRDTRI